ncbi:MAG: ABC transporter ATP-binding protein, partial [Myxococcota bacterium]
DLPRPETPPESPPGIRIEGLTFRYPGSDDDVPALHDVSLTVPAGGTLGVFGPTGSGKSTLLRCLTRLNDPPAGTVYVDDVDVRTLHLPTWREKAVLVPQRAFLFSETVSDNVLLGADPGLLDPLLERAQLKVDMDALPHGVSTEVGEAGLTLSGGQRQRVALARGLSRDASVLILDDVLSAVDHATEATLIAELQRMPRRPTTVIVANRISALRHANVIVVLDKGRVVATGTHDELVNLESPYREAWLRQSEREPVAESA